MSDSYLFVTKCIFPNLLLDKINSFGKKEQFRHCRAASLIKVLSYKENFGRVNISSNVWRKILGRAYRATINNLLKFNIIKIQQNESGGEVYSNGENSFCKCYYLSDEAINSGFTVKDFGTPKPKVCRNKLNSLDDIQLYIQNILNNNITIEYINNNTLNSYNNIIPCSASSHMWCKMESDVNFNTLINEIRAHDCLKRLAVKDYKITYGEKGGRLYHPIISMPKIGRKFVWFNNSDVIFDNDIKSCFPVLLLKYVHPDEKDAYKAALDSDIYSLIAGNDKRDECKDIFNFYINGNCSNYVKDWFRANLPKTAAWIETNYETMAARLQRDESDIMVQKLGRFVLDNKIDNWVCCHDGWLIDNESANQRIIGFVKSEVESACGYNPTIKTITRTRKTV
jgi:hypothetical protein